VHFIIRPTIDVIRRTSNVLIYPGSSTELKIRTTFLPLFTGSSFWSQRLHKKKNINT